MRDDNFFNNNNNNNENDINNSNNTNQEMNNNNSINNEVNTNETIIIEENGNPISENEVNFSIVNVEDVSSNEMGVSSMFNEKDETIYNQTTSDSQSTFAEQVNPDKQQINQTLHLASKLMEIKKKKHINQMIRFPDIM